MKLLGPALLLLLAGCGSSRDDSIEPIGEQGNAGSNELLSAADQAAGNAAARMSAEAGSNNQANLQGETRR